MASSKVVPISKSRDPLSNGWDAIIKGLGYDQSDPHLHDSPDRVARFFREWHTMGQEPPKLTLFKNDGYDQIIMEADIRFYSMCAHHGLPFTGRCAVAYIPRGWVVGLSKMARIVDFYAHRFQTQEQLTRQIADHLEKGLETPIGVGVIMQAEHLCMSMRGVERPGHMTTTSDVRGAFRNNPMARDEFLRLAGF